MIPSKFPEFSSVLIKVLPDGWEKVCLLGVITSNSYDMSFYVKVKNGYMQCFDLENEYAVTNEEIMEVFSDLNMLVKEDQANRGWTNMTFILFPSGEFSVDYDFTDLSTGFLMYKKNWKARYLV